MERKTSDSLLSHFEALRKALLWSFLAAGIAIPFCYAATPFVMERLIAYACPEGSRNLYFFSPMEVFVMRLKLAVVLGIVVTWPHTAWRIWEFLLPALYPKERGLLRFWLIASGILFLLGAGFCAVVILPMLMRFAMSFASSGIRPMIGLESFFDLAGMLLFAFGVMFQTPLAVLLAVRFGLVSVATLRRTRPYTVVLLLIAAAILTPPDVVSQLALFLPVWILFEAGLFFAARFEPPRETTVSSAAPDAEIPECYRDALARENDEKTKSER